MNAAQHAATKTNHGDTEARRHGETKSQTRMTRIGRMNANISLKNNAYGPQPPWAMLENSSQTG